jgi:peptidyl-dipeptidase A
MIGASHLTETQRFIEDTVAQWRELYRVYALSDWDMAVTGTPEANQASTEAQAAYMRFWSDPERYATAKRLYEAADPAADPAETRQLKLIYLAAAEHQQDEASIERITRLEAEIRGIYTNYRAEVGGRLLSDNELDDLLSKSTDSALVQAAWEASKKVGQQVAHLVRELAHARNAAARQQGYRDFFQRQLVLNEIDEDQLFDLFGQLEQATDAPFRALKAELDQARAERFGLQPGQLRPWHYGDRFFQQPPPDLGGVDLDRPFVDKDPVMLSLATFDGLGMEVGDVLERSDLYPRPGKNQHAFCTDIDREGDVRTLNNLQPNHRWNETLLHELGHAVYDKYQDRSLPWVLRGPPHTLTTEAIAILMGSLTYDQDWLTTIAGVPAGEAAALAKAGQAQERAVRLIFTRWVLVMTNFERALYADPDGDLDNIWWDLVERFQLLTRPEGRAAPDWAAKIHIALYPVYYHNYELGHLITAQLQSYLRRHAGGLVGRRAAGAWLIEKFFLPGNREDWTAHVARATGEPLSPKYFVESLG